MAWSPQQIVERRRLDHPDDATMRISHEAIYQAVFVQGRGVLRRELTACLRTGRALRVPRARTRGQGKSFVTPEILISQRPAEAEDRAVPGHWEGDLILWLRSWAIRTSGPAQDHRGSPTPLHLPPMKGHWPTGRARRTGQPSPGTAPRRSVTLITRTIITLPEQLRQSLTWGPGSGDGPAREAADRHGPAGLLLRPAQPLAARVTLAEAREQAFQLRCKLKREKIDPLEARRALQVGARLAALNGATFEQVARAVCRGPGDGEEVAR